MRHAGGRDDDLAGPGRDPLAGGEARLLGPGELALVPHGEGHVLRSEPGAARNLVEILPEIIHVAAGDARRPAGCARRST